MKSIITHTGVIHQKLNASLPADLLNLSFQLLRIEQITDDPVKHSLFFVLHICPIFRTDFSRQISLCVNLVRLLIRKASSKAIHLVSHLHQHSADLSADT